MKKIISTVMAITMSTSMMAIPSVSAAQTDAVYYSTGDVNCDGKVDITDLSTLSVALVDSNFDKIDTATADMDGDEEVNLADLATLRQVISKVRSQYPIYDIKECDKFTALVSHTDIVEKDGYIYQEGAGEFWRFEGIRKGNYLYLNGDSAFHDEMTEDNYDERDIAYIPMTTPCSITDIDYKYAIGMSDDYGEVSILSTVVHYDGGAENFGVGFDYKVQNIYKDGKQILVTASVYQPTLRNDYLLIGAQLSYDKTESYGRVPDAAAYWKALDSMGL